MVNFSRLLKELPELTAEQLKQIRDRTTILLQTSSSDAVPSSTTAGKDLDEPIDWLLEGYLTELRSRGISVGIKQTLKQVPGYKADSLMVRQHLLSASGQSMRTSQRLVLGRVAATALADWLAMANVPIRLKTLLQHTAHVPEAIDASYPGYQEAAVLGALCRERKNG